jgi:hypothetical protein
VVFRKKVLYFKFCDYDDDDDDGDIIMQSVSLYLIARAVGQILKLRWASEVSQMTS